MKPMGPLLKLQVIFTVDGQTKAGGLNLGKEKEENRFVGSLPGYRHTEVF